MGKSTQKIVSRNASSNLISEQLDILDNNFNFYHPWTLNSFELHDDCFIRGGAISSNVETQDIFARSIMVSGFSSNTTNELNEQTLSDFFSAFGSVSNVKISSDEQSDETTCLVTFQHGSEGARNAVKSQPIRMFGSMLRIEPARCNEVFQLNEKSLQINDSNDSREKSAPRYVLLVAPPYAGPWYKRSPDNPSYLKPSTLTSPPKAIKTVQKLATAASNMFLNNFNPLSTEIAPAKPTPDTLQKQHRQLTSSSLHSLLSPTARDSLFDDSTDHTPLQPQPQKESSECFDCDRVLPSWVWASISEGPNTSTELSAVNRELSNTLMLGRSTCSFLPLLAMLSNLYGRECGKDNNVFVESSNIHLLHKQTVVTVTNSLDDKKTGSYILYQSRHPCLAPLISMTTSCSNAELESDRKESIISVFDITPSRHKPLHELLRTDDFLTKPLCPGFEGHWEAELQRGNATCHYDSLPTKPLLAWFKKTSNNDEGLCKCRKIFDRGKESKIFQPDGNLRAELGQFRSSTSTMFSLMAEQEVFDDLRKLHLLPQTSPNHPQIYTRLNQTRALRRVGTSYHADVADLRIKFLALQLFHAISFLHSKGVTLGDQLRPDRMFIEKDGWLRLVVPIVQRHCSNDVTIIKEGLDEKTVSDSPKKSPIDSTKERRFIFNRYGDDNDFTTPEATIIPYPGYGLLPVKQWQKGQITNLAYLMMINAAAGRTIGNETNPPILPWVTDFSSEIDVNKNWNDEENILTPWRDLTKTKYRLHKGDEQLDHSYTYSAHHVPEPISDLTYTVYRARCTPLSELQARVRNRFIPEHYPGSVERLYLWTPDEATPEFYIHSHPCIFTSKHNEMNDMKLPSWCDNDPSLFVSYHRRLLESEQVSQYLHSWIDLLFGIALSGERAVLEKNVVLHHVKWNAVKNNFSSIDECSGGCCSTIVKKHIADGMIGNPRSVFVQLFMKPHPKRTSFAVRAHSAPPKQYWNNYKDNSNSFLLRKQHDISMMGAVLQECYASAQVIPDDNTQAAIDYLLEGKLDIKTSLQHNDSTDAPMEKRIFPFPECLQQAYDCLSDTQVVTFTRKPREVSSTDNSDATTRSSNLEKSWRIIRNGNVLSSLSNANCCLLSPALCTPLLSSQSFIENYKISRPYASFAEKLGRYITNLSKTVLDAMPLVIQFFDEVLSQTYDDSVVTESIGKLILDEGIASRLYRHSTWHEYVRHISNFVTTQLLVSNADMEQPIHLHVNSIVVYFVTFLARDNALGSSICCRYFVPLLVSHTEKCSMNGNKNMPVQVLRSLVPLLPSEAVGIIIVKPILKLMWQKLSHRVTAGQEGTANQIKHPAHVLSNIPIHLLRDLVSLLNVCLRKIESHAETYFFQSTPLCIPQLLLYSFKATTSHQDSENLDELKSVYRDVYTDSCLLIKSMIANANTDANYVHETLLPTIEALSSEVNDEYLSISMKRRKDDEFHCEDQQSLLLLPGIADACIIAKEAMRAFDYSLLKHKCPSAIELLAWVEIPWNIKNQPKNELTPKRERGNMTINEVEYGDNLEDDVPSMFGDNAIEMLAPKHSTILDDDSDESREDESAFESTAKGAIVDERRLSNMSSFRQSSFEMKHYHLNKQKRDIAWLIGVNRQSDQDQIKYLWQPRMMATTSLAPSSSAVSHDCKKGIITSMTTNKSESLLVAGNNIGEILLFDLRQHPPSVVYQRQVPNAEENVITDPKTIRQISFIGTSDEALVCNGGLHLWDVEGGNTKSSISSHNTSLEESRPWKVENLIGFSVFPPVTSSNEILLSGCGEVAAISSSYLYMIDMRCRFPSSSQNVIDQSSFSGNEQLDPMIRRLAWCTSSEIQYNHPHHSEKSPQVHSHVSSFNLKCVTSHSNWVCVGSSSGHIHCFDRRQSKLLLCWKAHSRAIEYLQAVSNHLLLSASADKTAVVWNLAQNPPMPISSIYNIPGKEGTMNIVSHYFEKDGIVSIPGRGNLLLCAATGRKAVFQPMLTENSSTGEDPIDVKADRIVMCDFDGAHIASSRKFNIHSIALLPLRQLVLLGCEDEVHVCL